MTPFMPPKAPLVAAGLLWLTTASTFSVVALSFAQPDWGTVVGRVVDTTNAPLDGVSVTIFPEREGAAMHTTTDFDGRYRFDDVPADTYRVDFRLNGFDLSRVSDLRVQPGATVGADGAMRVRINCDCVRKGVPVVTVAEPPEIKPLEGRVVDEAGRPLPYATLELNKEERRETAYTDREGRFLVRPPAGAWSITAFDIGFEPVSRDLSGNPGGSLIFRLPSAATLDVPNTERFNRACYCPGAIYFVHEQR